MQLGGLDEKAAQENAYLVSEAVAWQNLKRLLMINNEQLTDEIVERAVDMIDSAVVVERTPKTKFTAKNKDRRIWIWQQRSRLKRIYGLGAGLGIVGKDKDDMLHELIFSITGKDSVKQLDDSEFKAVQAELINRMKLADPNHLLHNTKSRNKKRKEAEEIGCNGYGYA